MNCSQYICDLTAIEMAQKIRARELSAREVMEAHLAQINKCNNEVNAIVTLLPEKELLAKADEADKAIHRGENIGPLHGLPIAHKDLALTKGIRTTFGSLIFKDFVPDENSLIVERIQKAGAISIGKTNVPEFGAGAQTFNQVFGSTQNPYDLTKTCGGSSGGAAAALASRMLPLADGSDLAGSIRIPASFCNVVGFRPSPGRVPMWPNLMWHPGWAVEGPMARTVKDTALLLSTIAGPDYLIPNSIQESGKIFENNLGKCFKDTKIAWGLNQRDIPVEPQINNAISKHRTVFEDLGCLMEDDFPNFKDADEIFMTFRAWLVEAKHRELLIKHRDKYKASLIWNIEQGKKLTGPQLAQIEIKRVELCRRIYKFMQKYEYLILPTCQVVPFDINQEYATEINGTKMNTYIDWLKATYYITTVGLPAISLPCGFTDEGLPIGIQIVGRPHDDLGVLQLAYAFEQKTNFWKIKPYGFN